MGLSRADEDLSVSFVPDDKPRRLDFDRRLAAYVRGHRERWDITAVLEPLQLLAGEDRPGRPAPAPQPAGKARSDDPVRASACIATAGA